MEKVKGLVLESTPDYVCLLTPGGEYVRVPSKRKVFPLGTEVELEYSRPVNTTRYLALAASLFLIIALAFTMQMAIFRPEAYLALDINPSLLLSLDKKAVVIKAEALNPEGEEILENLHLKGEQAGEAVALILGKAYLLNYLKAGTDNAIYISLAAPANYLLTENELRFSAEEKARNLELNTYLKVKGMGVEKALEAREKNVSLNSIMLQEELTKKGIWKEKEITKKEKPFPTTREIVKEAGAANVFSAEEFVAAGRSAGKKPEEAGPPGRLPVIEKGRPSLQLPGEEEGSTGSTLIIPGIVPPPEKGGRESRSDDRQQEKGTFPPVRRERIGPP